MEINNDITSEQDKRFLTKVGIAAGSVYVTVDQNVWGPPEETAKIYNKIYENIPMLKTFREEFIGDFIPKNAFTNFNFKDSWNSAVLSSFAFVADSPSKAVDLKDYLVDSVSSLMESQEPTEEKQT